MCFRPAVAAKPKICPSCGQINPVIAKACIKCKTELAKEETACPSCGHMNEVGAQACVSCGYEG